ncbi:MAG: pyrrolo-quinoline quinone [Planctomycetes bacterium]|nr:pyrrolo-quinoline quinone [Planctomycetota bacterium]
MNAQHRLLCLAAAAISLGHVARADDWPQWLGPARDAIWRERGLATAIPAAGLPLRWRVPVAGGYSGPAVAGGRVYLADYEVRTGELVNAPNDRSLRDGSERLLCLDAATGEVVWRHQADCRYSLSYASGPRCTPTVVDGRVYMLGAEGNLVCLDAETGRPLWGKDFKQEYSAPTPIWGFCGHPLVEGDLLICLVGGPGSVAVAFDRVTGAERWKALSASESGYCPPTIIEQGGTRQLLIWDADNLNALDPRTGRVLWSRPLKPMYGMSIMAPQVADTSLGRVLFASGIGRVAALYALAADGTGADVLWRGEPKSAMYCANSTPFIAGDTLYGCDCDTGALTAVALADGRRLWETLAATTGGDRRSKHGTAFLVRQAETVAGDPTGSTRAWIFSETGDLILARLSPERYQELGRMHLLEPTNECFGRDVVWSHPAFAGGCVFVRNDRELVCVQAAN